MTIKAIIQDTLALHKLERSLSKVENEKLQVLLQQSSTLQDLRIESIVSLIQSAHAIRRLLSEELVRLVDSTQITPVKVSQSPPPQEPQSAIPQPRVEQPKQTPKPLATSGSFDAVDPVDPFDEDPAPPQGLLANANASSQDTPFNVSDLDDLAKEVQSLTQPIFEAGDIPNIDEDFDPSLFADTGDVSPQLLQPSEDVDAQTNPPLPPSTSEAADDFSVTSLFPQSAGEAGTALLDAEAIERYKKLDQARARRERSSLVKLNVENPISLRTPHVSFDGQIFSMDSREIFVQTPERLLVGEQVELDFNLPMGGGHIECLGMVRERVEDAESDSERPVGLALRLLNLRPTQKAALNEVLTSINRL